MKPSEKKAAMDSFQAARDAIQAEADPLYAAIREYRDKGTPKAIIDRLKALGWSGVLAGMAGCSYPPEAHDWDAEVRKMAAMVEGKDDWSWTIIPHPLKWKASQIADKDVASFSRTLGKMQNRLQCLKAQLRFYELIGGDADVAGNLAWNVFYGWVRHAEAEYYARGHREQGAINEADGFETIRSGVAVIREKFPEETPTIPDGIDPATIQNARHGGAAKWRLTI